MRNTEYRVENTARGRAPLGNGKAISRGERDVKDIVERTFRFAVRIIGLVKAVPRDTAGQVIARQLARCGTGVGSNVEEAQGLHTRKDFARRMNTARTEARETLYWLRLLAETDMLPKAKLTEIITEADEITRILTAIVKNARRNE